MTRKIRWPLYLVLVLGVLAGAYAAAGYWLLPGIVEERIAEAARRRGLEFSAAEVRTDPFRLALALRDVRLVAPGQAVLTAPRARIDLSWRSLWRRALVVEEVATSGGTLEAMGVRLVALEASASRFSTLPGEDGGYAVSARVDGGGELFASGTLQLEPLVVRGHATASDVPLATAWHLARRDGDPPQGIAAASADFAYDGSLRLSNVQVAAHDVRYSGLAVPLELAEVTAHVESLGVPPREPFAFKAQAKMPDNGTLSLEGTLDTQAPRLDARLTASGLQLSLAQGFVDEATRARIAAGAVAAEGDLLWAEGAGTYRGSLAVQGARVEEADSDTLLFAAERLASGQVTVRFPALAVSIGEAQATAPAARVVIEAGGKLNLVEAFRGQGEDKGEAPPFELRRLAVEGGRLEFADRSLASPFGTTVSQLEGTISGLSTAPGEAARIRLDGRVGRYGSARLRGTLDITAPREAADLRLTFRNLALADFTPYAAKFAGYRIESGRLSAELRYRVDDGRLTGQNRLTFERLKLGEKVRERPVLDLPVELAVALLSDAKGQINLAIPVSGNLADPKFDMGGLVAKALGNALGKIVSAPFRLLARLGGRGEEEADEIHFAAGTAALTPPQEETIASVAKALAARPRVGLTVRGGYDAESDLPGLRARSVRRELARRAGYDVEQAAQPGAIDLRDEKIVRAAQALFLERGGTREALEALRAGETPLGRALFERLVAQTQFAPGAAQALAEARGYVVREALIAHGASAQRVQLEPPAETAREEGGVPTVLEVRPL